MKVGDVIKWTSEDGTSKAIIGEVIAITDKRIKFKVPEGTVEIPLSEGKFELTTEKLDFTKPPDPPKKKRSKKKAPTAGSKTEAALKLYRSMNGSTRAEIIKAFVDKVGLTPAGAATYYTNCKKVVDNER